MQLREYHFGRRDPFRLVDIHRDDPAVVLHHDTVVHADLDDDGIAESSGRFVNAVIHNFINKMMQPFLTRGADVHGGTLAHRLQSLEDLDAVRGILGFLHVVISVKKIRPSGQVHPTPFRAFLSIFIITKIGLKVKGSTSRWRDSILFNICLLRTFWGGFPEIWRNSSFPFPPEAGTR